MTIHCSNRRANHLVTAVILSEAKDLLSLIHPILLRCHFGCLSAINTPPEA